MKKLENLKEGKTLYKSHRAEPYFTFIKEGVKNVEGRINKGLYLELKVGDEIQIFENIESQNIRAEVIALRNYSSMSEMLEKEDLKEVLPDANSVEEGVRIYRKFYTEEQEKEFGVLAIEIKLI